MNTCSIAFLHASILSNDNPAVTGFLFNEIFLDEYAAVLTSCLLIFVLSKQSIQRSAILLNDFNPINNLSKLLSETLFNAAKIKFVTT